MGENDDQLLAAGRELAGYLLDRGLTPDMSVLDVGCGYGRLAIGLLDRVHYRGRYLGFDILKRQIAWCAATLTPHYPNLRFTHIDVRNDRYNPQGRVDPDHLRLPAASGSFDMCAMISVCTHLYRPQIERYLGEIERVLKPGGVAVTTWFLFDEARLPAAMADDAAYPMRHVLDADTRYTKEGEPLRAIAFHERAMAEMAAGAGLEIVSIEYGRWTGGEATHTQDIVLFRRQRARSAVSDGLRDAPWQVRRYVRAAGRRVRRLGRATGIRSRN
jgi:SAM-dependent methyltransferase